MGRSLAILKGFTENFHPEGFEFLIEVGTSSVAGDEEEMWQKSGEIGLHPVQEGESIHACHADVGDDKIEVGGLEKFDGFEAIGGAFDVATEFGAESFVDKAGDEFLVIDDEHAAAESEIVAVGGGGVLENGGNVFGFDAREGDEELGAQVDFAFDVDAAFVLFDDGEADAEAQAGAGGGAFGGEKRIEDAS